MGLNIDELKICFPQQQLVKLKWNKRSSCAIALSIVAHSKNTNANLCIKHINTYTNNKREFVCIMATNNVELDPFYNARVRLQQGNTSNRLCGAEYLNSWSAALCLLLNHIWLWWKYNQTHIQFTVLTVAACIRTQHTYVDNIDMRIIDVCDMVPTSRIYSYAIHIWLA